MTILNITSNITCVRSFPAKKKGFQWYLPGGSETKQNKKSPLLAIFSSIDIINYNLIEQKRDCFKACRGSRNSGRNHGPRSKYGTGRDRVEERMEPYVGRGCTTRVGKAEAWLLRVGGNGTSNDYADILSASVRPGRSRETHRLPSTYRTHVVWYFSLSFAHVGFHTHSPICVSVYFIHIRV